VDEIYVLNVKAGAIHTTIKGKKIKSWRFANQKGIQRKGVTPTFILTVDVS
jgi:hypothetical protein